MLRPQIYGIPDGYKTSFKKKKKVIVKPWCVEHTVYKVTYIKDASESDRISVIFQSKNVFITFGLFNSLFKGTIRGTKQGCDEESWDPNPESAEVQGHSHPNMLFLSEIRK